MYIFAEWTNIWNNIDVSGSLVCLSIIDLFYFRFDIVKLFKSSYDLIILFRIASTLLNFTLSMIASHSLLKARRICFTLSATSFSPAQRCCCKWNLLESLQLCYFWSGSTLDISELEDVMLLSLGCFEPLLLSIKANQIKTIKVRIQQSYNDHRIPVLLIMTSNTPDGSNLGADRNI